MKGYLGVSHLDYPDDPDGFLHALGRVEWWPFIGFLLPIGSLVLTRGFDITWVKGVSPPLWYGLLLVIPGFTFPFVYWIVDNLQKQLRKKIAIDESVDIAGQVKLLYSNKSPCLWQVFYKIRYVGGLTIFCVLTTINWGISSLIYFGLGRV